MKNKFAFSLSALFVLSASNVFAAAPPAGQTQFAARLYSEGLGRAPDEGAWDNTISSAKALGCDKNVAIGSAKTIFLSNEFAAVTGTDYANKIMRLYRATLFRDPDQGGFDYWVGVGQRTGNWHGIVDSILNSSEFAAIVSTYICNQDINGDSVVGMAEHWTPLRAINSSAGDFNGGTGAQLQALLDNAAALAASSGTPKTIALNQGAIVSINDGKSIVVGPNVTLTTYGNPDPSQYPKMGRILRNSIMTGPLVVMQKNAVLTHVWVDGMRSTVYPKQANKTYDSSVEANNIQVRGENVRVENNFVTDPVSWSAIYYSTNYGPCAGGRIIGNLITLYGSGHYAVKVGTTSKASWTDGISVACGNTEIAYNRVIDATDVGIILFRNAANDPNLGVSTNPAAIQNSSVHDNMVISAGNSAYGALSTDPLNRCQKQENTLGVAHSNACSTTNKAPFSGTKFDRNLIYGTPSTHFDIVLAIGTRPWFGENSITGEGAAFTNNKTVGGSIVANTGIFVAGMRNATVTNNSFNLSITQKAGCPAGFAFAATTYSNGPYTFDSSSGLLFYGNLNNGTATSVANTNLTTACIGH